MTNTFSSPLPSKQKTNAEPDASPAPACLFTPPQAGMRVHHHQRDGECRSLAKTPGGSTVPFPKHPGASHQEMDNHQGIRITESDFYKKNSYRIKFDSLLLSLSNLRNRTNTDFAKYERSQRKKSTVIYDEAHHKATIIKINLVLAKIKTTLSWPQNEIDILQQLNQAIYENASIALWALSISTQI